MMVVVEDFRRNKLREGRRPDAGDDVEQNGGLEEMELTIDDTTLLCVASPIMYPLWDSLTATANISQESVLLLCKL
ncbi:hypothetical protein F2Q68_00011375 [Brassica cretica]|uniref:Uncharacterized protein n=1 Tax=Brassica cretica TaxID=69181 RepID=A0A8S9KWT7_BRACR|nr:hypothetical protein F2Q68_00011375 [Brassica cretica]